MPFESIAPNERRYLLYAVDVDLDLDAQFYAIQSLLAANHNADRELTRHIESLVNEAKSEWPMDARLEFLELVEANGWKEWFDKSESDHKPKIIYMSEAFTDHCVKFSGDLLDGLGAFVWEASQDG